MEANTYTYTASTNTLKQKAEIEKPYKSDFTDEGIYTDETSYDWEGYENAISAYNAHLASLKEIACEPGCKEVWKDGDTVVEGKDFEVVFRDEACYDDCEKGGCHSAAECKYVDETALMAFPLTPKSEDELWAEVIRYLINNPGLSYNTKVGDLKNSFTLIKK